MTQPELNAAVVYYGTSPAEVSDYERIQAPVLGHYGGDDQRVNATVPEARAAMKALGKPYAPFYYEGACHGFPSSSSRPRGCEPACHPTGPGPARSRFSGNASKVSGLSPQAT